MKFPTLTEKAAIFLSFLCLTASYSSAAIGDADAQYRSRFGKPTHTVDVGSGHQGLIYVKRPRAVFVVFENGKSVGEMILKGTDISPAEISNVLNANSQGVPWRKENITKGKGDEEKMRAQGILDVQIWSRTDGKLFATYMHTKSGGNEMRAILIGNKQGVKLVTAMASANKQFQPKPVQ